MTQPRVYLFDTTAALFAQVIPAGNQGFFVITPATHNIANDTFVNAYSGTAATPANCVGMNICRVGNDFHTKARTPKPFTNGLYVLAPNNNVNWNVYTWDDDLN